MPYALAQTHQNLYVAEQQYAIAKKVRFTYLDSCLGVGGRRTDGQVIGVHLVMMGRDGGWFDEDGANAVVAILQACEETILIGDSVTWAGTAFTSDGYASMVERLGPRVISMAHARALQFRVSHGRLRYKLNADRWCSCLGF